MPFRASRDMVGNKCAPLAYRFLLAFRGVLRRLQYELGIDLGVEQHILTVSRRLGHANASITLNVYGHLIEGADASAAKAIEGMLK